MRSRVYVVFCGLLAGGLGALANVQSDRAAIAPSAANLQLLPGFQAEVVRAAQPGEGSWVCLTVDARGRLIISPEALAEKDAAGKPVRGGLLRVTISAEGKAEKVEPIALPIGAAMGLLYAYDSLYVSGQGPDGTGLYRLRDSNGDDQFDQLELLKQFEGTARVPAVGEHGPHAIVLGPDGMLYVINGNEVKVPEGVSPASPHRNFAEDQLLPPQLWPPNHTWANGPPPGGYVVRTDRDGKEWTLLGGGLRNAYDLAFNRDGEMFTFDSDMDWDDGAPWYRPSRINHLVSGGEYGWRKGTGKWPDHYPDSLPTTLDLGRTSPTGMKFGYAAQFPRQYRYALFACDWAFGTIYAVHLTPSGASYKARAEAFITGKPLNVTDVEFGADGAMYFLTGGRGTQSALYRVTYEESITRQSPVWTLADQVALRARELRRQLEAFHGRSDPAAVDFAWPHLDDADPWLRYAARIAIEAQDPALWQNRALEERRPTASLAALLALARVGDAALQADLLRSLGRLKPEELSESQQLAAARVLSLAFIRMGRPAPDTTANLAKRLDAFYPAKNDLLDRELCRLLVYLEAPNVISRTLPLLETAATQEQQMHYAFCLRLVRAGWTREQRVAYLNWFPRAAANYQGSSKFLDFLATTAREAMETLSAEERRELAAFLEQWELVRKPAPPAPARAFVKEWKMEDLLPALEEVGRGRSFQKGREAFAATQCLQCHRFGNEGGAIGPDITAAASRFNRRDLLEAILEPSKVVSDQFQNTLIVTRAGEVYTGRIMRETEQQIWIAPDPLTAEEIEIKQGDVQARRISELSPMPEGLVNTLTRAEILDLLAYIESGGDAGHRVFRGSQ